MAASYLRFLANVVIGLLFGLATGLILELIGAPRGWAITLMFLGAIVGAVLFVVMPPPERT